MVCLEIFINHCNQNLEFFREVWEHQTGTNFNDIEPMYYFFWDTLFDLGV